jgi:hypothetical protein
MGTVSAASATIDYRQAAIYVVILQQVRRKCIAAGLTNCMPPPIRTGFEHPDSRVNPNRTAFSHL